MPGENSAHATAVPETSSRDHARPAADDDRAGEPVRAAAAPEHPAAGHEPAAENAEQEPVEQLDPETLARREAALRQIRQFGDPVLRARALPVERFDEALRAEVERMGELMQDALGVGLAANQVGVLHRVFVYRTEPEGEVRALVNPEIEEAGEERERAEEGCLSIAGVHVEVDRPAHVRVRAQDTNGAEVRLEAEGLEARVIQHELDHLDGVLILDRISREERREAMRALREARREARAPVDSAQS
jgi:peptide deformylase